jgi:D-glycero-D-manno-heptose 1,7-bisphosphate phosphatase
VTKLRQAVLLDRDGTINVDAGYVERLDRFEIYPFAMDAIRIFTQAGYLVVVITNQAGVAHGMYGEDFVATMAQHLVERAEARGGRIDGHYFCPHSPDAAVPQYRVECECRKPKAGLALRAARELGIDLTRSVVIGDRWRDLAVATAVGARGILVKTGYGATEALRPQPGIRADAVCQDLIGAAVWLLDHPLP